MTRARTPVTSRPPCLPSRESGPSRGGNCPTFASDDVRPAAPKSVPFVAPAVAMSAATAISVKPASPSVACSLVVFLLVGLAGYRLRSETGASAAIVLLGMAATAVVLGFFAVDTLPNDPDTFTAIVAMTLLAVGLDFVCKRVRGPSSGASDEVLATVAPQ